MFTNASGKYSTLLKLYKPQLRCGSGGFAGQYSTLLKLYKPQPISNIDGAPVKYSTLLKLYKPQPGAARLADLEEYSTLQKNIKSQPCDQLGYNLPNIALKRRRSTRTCQQVLPAARMQIKPCIFSLPPAFFSKLLLRFFFFCGHAKRKSVHKKV